MSAFSRKQIRHIPNLRMYARERPQIRHRLYARTRYLAGRWDLTISDFFAKGCSFYARAGKRHTLIRRSWLVLITKWHTETLQERVALRVVGRGGDNCYLQAANFVYLVVLDFWKDDLLAQA